MIYFCFDNIMLDRIEREDLYMLRRERNMFSLRKWCRQKDLIHPEEQDLWFERQMIDPSIEMYTVKYGNNIVGVVGLTDLDMHNRKAEFSCYIFASERGKGYASAALKTLFNHGFHNRGLNRIWGETYHGNPASMLFAKLGMVLEGTMRETYFKSGIFLDSHIYGLLLEDWILTDYNRLTEINH